MSGVEVEQRLEIDGLGDFVFNIPAPVASVRDLPASQSVPGLRQSSIVWEGFSRGHKILDVLATLRVKEIEPLLPLKVRVSAQLAARFKIVIEVANGPRTPVQSFTGQANAREVAAKMDAIRAAVAAGKPPPAELVQVGGKLRPVTIQAEPLFRAAGTITIPGTAAGVQVSGAQVISRSPLRLRFSARVGAGSPPVTIVVTGTGKVGLPKLDLTAAPLPPVAALDLPGGLGWSEALRRGDLPSDGRALLRLAIRHLVEAAYTQQFRTLLATPDRAQPSVTTYRFRTGAPARQAPAATAPADGGSDTLTFVGIGLAVLAAGGLLVYWAHS